MDNRVVNDIATGGVDASSSAASAIATNGVMVGSVTAGGSATGVCRAAGDFVATGSAAGGVCAGQQRGWRQRNEQRRGGRYCGVVAVSTVAGGVTGNGSAADVTAASESMHLFI